MQRLQHGLWVTFRNAEEGALAAFVAAVALFSVLEGAGLMPMGSNSTAPKVLAIPA
jgi:hypothetical protein